MNVDDASVVGNSIGGGGYGGGRGAGIYNSGMLDVAYATISGNSIGGGSFGEAEGGGVFNDASGRASVTHATISGNSLAGQLLTGGIGGGIDNVGAMSVVDTTIIGNTASGSRVLGQGSSTGEGEGGGILNLGTLSVTYGTISGNSVSAGVYSTIKGDVTTPGMGGGIEVGGSTILTDTIVAGNAQAGTSQFTDVTGTVDATSAHNLIGDGTGMGGLTSGTNGNRIGTAAAPIDPLLGPLADNGGDTLTAALLPGSPAVDAGIAVSGVTTDERGLDRDRGIAPDIGAFEVQQPPSLVVETVQIRLHPRVLILTFSEPLDAARAENAANYQLVGAASKRRLEHGHGHVFRFRPIRYVPGSEAVFLRPIRRIPLCATYRLTVIGTPPGGLTDTEGVFLNGAGSNVGGSDYVATFRGKKLVAPRRIPSAHLAMPFDRAHRFFGHQQT